MICDSAKATRWRSWSSPAIAWLQYESKKLVRLSCWPTDARSAAAWFM